MPNLILITLLVYGVSETWGSTSPGEVGGICLPDTRRPCRQNHSDCIEGVCLCSNFYRFVNGTCVSHDESATLGETCRSGGDCRGQGEFCSSFSVCMCLSTHVDVGTHCRPAVYPGQFGCEDSRQCSKGFPGAECDSNRRCVCPHGMQAHQQTCVVPSALANVILSDDQFNRGFYQRRDRFPVNNFYRRRYSPSSNSANGVAPDAVCSVDSDCAGYPLAYCDGVCRCVQGALNAGSTCISSGNAVQPAGSCPPGQTYVTEAGACMTAQQPGDPCQYSQQCAAAEPGAFCLRLRCECVYGMRQSGTGCTFVDNQCTQRGFIWISELGECKEVLPPGGLGCSHSLQCTEAYAEASCFLQTCTCPPTHPVAIDGTCGRNCSAGETYSGVTGQCLPTVQPGDQCLYSSQCHAIFPGMVCDRNRCRCPNGMVFSGSKCAQICPAGYITNSRGVCMPGCRPNQVEFEGECLDQSAPGSACVVNAQCTGGASCQSGQCQCPKAMIPRGSVCVFAESAPLGSCASGEMCTGGSFCSNGNCTCPVGRQIVNSQCVTPLTVPPNSPCSPSVSCGGGSACIGSVCQCPVNQQIIEGACKIPPTVLPGNPCPSGLERCLGQSSCIDGVCQCPFGTYPNQNECLPIRSAAAGDPCGTTIRCQGLAVCVDGSCQCPSGLKVIEGECRSATQVAPGSSCAAAEVCAGGSYCAADVCVCPQGTKASNGVCQRVISVAPGQACANGEVCSGGSNCQQEVCVCPLGTVNFQGVCQSSTGSLGQCDSMQQCTGGAFCDTLRNQCTCPANTVIVGSLCLSSQQLSISREPQEVACSYDSDCDSGKVCVLRRCQCMFGQLADGSCKNLWSNRKMSRKPSEDEGKGEEQVNHVQIALPKAREELRAASSVSNISNVVDIGGSCVRVGVSCGGGAICVAGLCVCPLGTSPWQNICVDHKTANPGESCSRGEECVGGSGCSEISRKCECLRETQMVIGSSCQERLRSHPGYPCSNGEMCVGRSSCQDGRCACGHGMIEVNKQCVNRPIVGAGDSCSNGEVCGGGSSCDYSQKKCICKRGQQIINHQCTEVQVVAPGASCSAALVRCGGGAYCVRGRCECPSSMIPLDGKCAVQKQVAPGNTCSSADVCMGRSTCREGTCQCQSDSVLRGGRCEIKRKALPMEPCRPGDECLGDSKCNGHICECAPGHVRRDNACKPRLTKRPGLPCSNEDLCTGMSICSQGMCQCRPGETIQGGKCMKGKQVLPGGACVREDECTGGAYCRGGVCMCPVGKAIKAQQCVDVTRSPAGGTCSNGEMCDGGSFCHLASLRCRCPEGFQTKNGVCQRMEQRKIPTMVSASTRRPYTTRGGPARPLPKRPTTSRPLDRPSCRSNSECPTGAICKNRICVCAQNMVMKDGECIVYSQTIKKRAGLLKEPCSDDSQCSVVNSYCHPMGICGCLPGFRLFGSTQCIRRMDIQNYRVMSSTVPPDTTTTPMTTTTTTTTEVPTTTTTEIVTTAITTSSSSEEEEDLPVFSKPRWVLPGEECDREKALCHLGSFCQEGVCRCPPGFTLIHNSCMRKASAKTVPPLASCVAGERCGGGSECVYGLCFCTADRTLFRGNCSTLEEIDMIRAIEASSVTATPLTRDRFHSLKTTVLTITEPTTTVGLTTATTTTTTEPPTTVQTTIQTTTASTTTEQTTPTTTTRRISTMRFTTSEKPRKMEKTPAPEFWFKIARPGHKCDDTTFCTNCSICVGGSCICPEGLEMVGEQCLSPIDARQCLASNQCPSGAECVGGECRCSPGLALSRFGFCMPLTYVDPGMSCSEGETCRGGSECKEGMCVCSQGLFIRNNKCQPPVRVKRRIYSGINNKDEEFVKKMNEMESSLNPRSNQPITPTTRRTSLGERCSSSSVCTDGGVCGQGICRCASGQVQAGNSCLQRETIASSIASPGASCQSGVFCDGGASCVNYVCACPSGFTVENGICTPVLARASDPCNNGERCSFGSLCVQGMCVCPSGMTEIDGNCIAISQNIAKSPGVNCLNNPSICSGGSFCVQGVCTCPLGTEPQAGICVPSSSIGGTTYSSPGVPCVDGQVICTGNSVCANGFCVCPGGEQIKNDMCISLDSQADPGQMCEEGVTVCTGNSQCTNGICRCPEGQTSLNGQCARVITSFTVAPPICQPRCGTNSICVQGNCQCNTGYLPSPTGCQPSCSQPCSPNASCQQGQCQCNLGYIPSGNLCLPALNPSIQPSPYFGLPGQQCDLRQGAMLCRNRALCIRGQCMCPTNMILSQQRCVEYAGDAYPGQSCATAGIICRGGSSCSENICKCQVGFYASGPQCIPNTPPFQFTFVPFPPITTQSPIFGFELRPGAQCEPRCEFEPCLQRCGGGSICTGGYCTCPLGTYDYQGTCTPMAIEPATQSPFPTTRSSLSARPGDYCDSGISCTGGSSCILGTCTCDLGYTPSFDRSSCMLASLPGSMRSYPGDQCTKDSDCVGNSFCSGKVCSCLSDEEISDRKCTRRTSAGLALPGSPCTASSPCQTGSICLQDYCICQSGLTTNSTGHCVFAGMSDTSSALPGAPCSQGGPPCEGSSWCVDGHCLCPIGTLNQGEGRCVDQKEKTPPQMPQPQPFVAKVLGEFCSLQSECASILHATCLNFRCHCSSDYMERDKQCILRREVPSVSSRKSCSSFRDCDSPRVCSSLSVCECPFTMSETGNGVCIYKDNTVPVGSYCSATAGVSCQSDAVCLDHLCSCMPGYTQIDEKCVAVITVLPGSACSRGEVCGGGAVCTNGLCLCQNGLSIDGRNCKSISKREYNQHESQQLVHQSAERLTPCPSDGSCKLPDCFCSRSGTSPPGDLQPKQVPQMIILSFDDAITDRTINIYKSMFNGKLRNPNGCPIKGTFFVSHQFNNYDQTQWLHSRGNEIALNSITHETLMNATQERWRHEMVGLRESLQAFSYIEATAIKGVRAPQLLIGGDAQFDMMSENGLLYDNSMPVREGPVWPQTLDHQLSWDCGEQNCPQKRHRGLWEVPIQLMVANDGIWHTMARTAIKPYDTRESTRRLLERNFYRNYNGNRAPFVLTADSDFLTYLPDNGVVHAIEDWLSGVLNKTDVYVVTASQAIEWMRKPRQLDEITKFKPWHCNFRLNDHIQPCETPSICSYDSRSPTGLPHSFRVCGSCPKAYPWIEDPLGKKQLRKK